MIAVNIDGRASDEYIEDRTGEVSLILDDPYEREYDNVPPGTDDPDSYMEANGLVDERAPEAWCNSAGVDIRKDSVQVWISIGDPRGAFVMEARKLEDGRIVLHLPYPGESLPQMETEHLHGGTLVVTNTKP